MGKSYLIGTDIGTSGTKSIIMDTEGDLIASALSEYDVLIPRALWAEQWPDVWVEAVKESIKNVVTKSNVDPKQIAGICISGLYGGSGIPCDQNMEPIRPCIIWMDRRASEESKWAVENIGEEKLYNITSNGTDPYYGFTKILWIKNKEPENWKKIKMFIPPNYYAIYKLTNEIAIDHSSAGNIGGIFDVKTRSWSKQMLEAMGIPERFMPERIVPSGEVVGKLTDKAAKEIGLVSGIPVLAGGIDCIVATLGAGVLDPGQHVAMIGTSMAWGFVHDKPLGPKGLITMPYVKDSTELLYSFGGAATAGALLKWFRDNFAQAEVVNEKKTGVNAYQVLDKEAEGISAGSKGLVILPYFMGERSPIWDLTARGTIFGLTLDQKRGHVYRALMEAVAYSLKNSMESAEGNIELGDELIVTGGVTKSKLWRQIFADVTGYSILCPSKEVEATLGDIFLAGVGTNTIEYSQAKNWVEFDDVVNPEPEASKIYAEYYKQYKEVYLNIKGNMKKMADILSKFDNNG